MIRKISLLCFAALSAVTMMAQSQTKTITVDVKNPSKETRADVPVVIDLNNLNLGFTVKSAVVMSGQEEIPSQLDDLTRNRKADELAFVADVAGKKTRSFTITLSSEKSDKTYEPRVFAEMLMSDRKGKHVPIQSLTIPGTSNVYNQLHHHGPAFESELVAYRMYFDQKQTLDIYGKFNKGFEIEESQFYPTDEQLARGFGDDVLRVSGSAGAGSFKGWNGKKALHIEPVDTRTERIVSYGPIRTIVENEVEGWQYQGNELNMTTRYTLYAGHRDLFVEAFFDEPLANETFATGVQDVKGSVSFSDNKGLIGCWGTDWPVNDTIKYAKETVGLATFVPKKYVVQEAKDKPNYLYIMSAPGQNYMNYYTTFTSLKETFGYNTPEAWFNHIQAWRDELENPCIITIKE